MTTFKKTLLTAAAILPLVALSLPSHAVMDSYMEKALINVCKAAKSNSVLKLKSTTKYYRLKTKTVALGLVCNGDDVITFAESYGANKTAATLQKSIGRVSITDVASVQKLNVTF
ncbi:DUF3718 domain-containing protein [Colwellia sp. D2M02]|uniref:DUF3718 domain-containing protein n=1 Tax=Colwellia sp. D2M02 TaxID=2841562 RepID=UPI001C0A4EC7|nr:DUF3718 domain-containing protein [Colwellia sp. D2M02]MBU2893109.1 DUF3718 domain-containing protein [Colwellia sp. D2M02]